MSPSFCFLVFKMDMVKLTSNCWDDNYMRKLYRTVSKFRLKKMHVLTFLYEGRGEEEGLLELLKWQSFAPERP